MGDLKKILIAEDDKPMARAMELKLIKSGYNVKIAFNGEEALKMIETGNFDLVLLDLIMPKKDGFSVLTELKAKGNQTPIIVSSNLGQEEDFQKARELGAKDYFVKSDTPITEVVEHVKRILNM